MSNVGAVRAGRAYVELYGDKSPLVRELRSAEGLIKKWGSAIQSAGMNTFAVGASILAPLINGARVFTALGGSIDDAAQRTGAGVEFLSRAGFAAERTGANLGDIETGMRMLAKSGKFAGMSVEDAFESALSQIAAAEDPMERTKLAIELFGKSGTSLIPLATQYEELIDLADRLNITMREDAVSAADTLGDVWTELVATWNSLNNAIGEALADDFVKLLQWGRDVLAWSSKWIQENQEVVRIALYVGVAIAAIGAALVAVGGAMVAASAVVAAGITMWTSAVWALGVAWSSTVFMLLNPWGQLYLAIRGAMVWFLYFTDAGRELRSAFSEYMAHIWQHFSSAFGAIIRAVQAGELQMAWDIALGAVKVSVLEFAQFLLTAYSPALKSVGLMFERLGEGIVGVFNWVKESVLNRISEIKAAAGFATNSLARFAGKYLGAKGIAPALMGSDADVEARLQAEYLKNKSPTAPKIPSPTGMAVDGLAATLEATTNAAKAELERLKAAANALPVPAPLDVKRGMADLGGGGEIKRASSGTFSAFAARGFGGGTLDTIATATKQTAKNTDPRNQKRGVPVT